MLRFNIAEPARTEESEALAQRCLAKCWIEGSFEVERKQEWDAEALIQVFVV
jgi:hypothetical protein